MSQLGRISGPLLKANLLRQGVDLAFETDLLYLDVNNRRIGIKTATPTHELQVNGTLRTTNLEVVGTTAQLGDFTFSPNTITYDGDLTFNLPEGSALRTSKFSIDTIDIFNNIIATNESNANLEIRPSGTGIVDVKSGIQVTGSLQVDGAITADGNITLGDADTDTLTINAEINSNIIPDANETYQIGSNPSTGGKRWNDVWARNLFADVITSQNLIIDGVNISALPGNIYYVSAVNGSDTHQGEHPNDTLATIKYALTLASAGDTVYLYPGVYEEIFPLEVPVGVTVKGVGIRSVKVVPTDATKYNNAFLMNGETTIEDLTVADFFYDSINDTGYAFSFANDFTVTTRSPYIRNISVLTKGSVTSPEDPLGFNQGDAGCGANADGSVANAASKEASMLFHSVTFITPGVDALRCTNGVRIEWLNSFTYFANKGMNLYSSNDGFAGIGKTRLRVYGISAETLVVGDTITVENVREAGTSTTGTIESFTYDSPHTDIIIDGFVDGFEESLSPPDTSDQQVITFSGGQTASHVVRADYSDFGAELRSIGSACVYGNYGAYGDGNGVIAYLIGQNLAYIGLGGDSSNDPGLVIQANEVTQLNRAKIYYTSVDHKGDFRVGEQFYVNQDTGEAVFSNSDVAVTGSLLFNSGINQTYIDAFKIETGDFRISNNTVETLSQVMNINSFTGEVNFLNNVNIAGDLDVTGNVTIGGNITIGDQTTDTVNIEARIDSDIVPKLNDTYNLGTTIERWRQIFVNRLTADNIEIVDNKISTLDSNSDLELSAAGTGKVLIPNNDLQVTDTVTVLGTTDLQTTNINGTLTLTGNANITGNVVQNGDLSVSGAFFSASLDLENIEIVQNNIRTKNSNQDLQLEASGTGQIYIPSNDVQIDQNLTVDGLITGTTITNSGTVTSTIIRNENIVIASNTISATLSNSNLELRSNGTGKIYVSSSDVQIDEDLEVVGNTNLATTNITGILTVVGNVVQTGNYTQTGDFGITGNLSVSNAAQFENILIDNNVITTTESNSDLELRANGTGNVIIDNTDLEVTGDLDVVGTLSANSLNITTDITADRYTNGNILIENNVISTTASNSDLELRANGSGDVEVTSDLVINENMFVSGTATLADTNVTGFILHVGDLSHTGSATHTGDYTLNGNLTVSSFAQFENIRIDGNQLSTTDSNSNLELIASGSGIVSIPNNNVIVGQDLTVNGSLTVENLSLTILETEIVQTSDIRIQNNFITTTLSNSDLELRANGTGRVLIPTADFVVENDLTVQGDTELQTTTITGTLTQNGNTVHTGNTTQTGDYILNGNLDVSGLTEIADIQINGNQISSKNGYNLVLDAPGSGIVYIPENDVLIENDLFVNGTLYANNVIGTFGSLQANEIDTGNIVVRGNRITTTLSNSDLELRANGTGSVIIDDTDLVVNGDLLVSSDVQLNNTTVVGTFTHTGVANHTGTVNQTGTLNVSGNMNITGTAQFFNIRVEGNVIRTTLPGSDLTFQATGAGIITVPFNDVEISQNLSVLGDITTTDIVASQSITAPVINLGAITISGNIITTNVSNTNLELRANGTGGVELESVIVNQNQITTLTDTNLVIAPNGTGIVDFQGTQAIRLPRGTDLQRPAGQAGQVRYNTDRNYYEGYDGANWRRLDGVYDLDENTYITAETTPGANDNVISFYINGLNRANLTASEFSTSNLDISNINITGNTISTTNTDGNLVLAPNGTGSTVIGFFALRNNTITNTQADTITSFNQTGTGYFKIAGTNGFVLPRGRVDQRGALVETGMMRYNTTDSRVEVYDGTQWVSAAGSSGSGITLSEAEGLAITTALIFG